MKCSPDLRKIYRVPTRESCVLATKSYLRDFTVSYPEQGWKN